MNELQLFNFENNQVRTLLINDEPWFVGKDVAQILGYSNPRDALSKHVDNEDKNSVAIRDGNKGNPNQTVINESGVSLTTISKAYNGKPISDKSAKKIADALVINLDLLIKKGV